MTNTERGERLLEGAEELHRELKSALERESWNLAVRRAQEVVELTLKGLLSLMGVEYPKVHDVGQVFAREVEERKLAIPEEMLSEIEDISADLARKRAPAFYFEAEHDEAEARTAFTHAVKVLQLGRQLAIRLQESIEDEPENAGQLDG